MTESKSLKSFKNFITSFFKAFCTSVFGFIITPIVILNIGDEAYGLYKLIFDWLSNVWMFDLGISGAFLAVSAIYYRKNNFKDVYADGFKLHIQVLPLLILSSILFYFVILNLTSLEAVSVRTYTISFCVIAASFLFYPFNVFRQYFEVSERQSLINWVTIAQLFLTNLFILIAAKMGYGLIGISCVYSFFIVLSYFILYFLFYREKSLSLSFLLKGRGEFSREIKNTGKSYLFINISQKISFLADNSIIAYFYSPAEVVFFFISQRLPALFQTQIQGLSFSTWASLVDFYNKGDVENFRQKFLEILKLNLLIASLAALLCLTLNEQFVSLWIGDKYYIDNSFNLIASLLLIVNVLNFYIGHIMTGTGLIKKQSGAYIVLGIANLLLSILFTKIWGFHGPIFASLITMSLLMLFKFFLMNKHYGLSRESLFIIVLKQVALVSLMTLFIDWVLSYYYKSNWFIFCLFGVLVASLYLLGAYFFIFNRAERVIWKERFLRIFRAYFKKSE